MAKAAKKSKKAAPLDYRVALWNLDAGTDAGDGVRAILKELGIPARTITAEHLGDPVGAVAGMIGFRPSLRPFDGTAPQEPFLLMCNLTNAQVDALLTQLRQAQVSIPYKAMVTKFNKAWPLIQLMGQVQQEHAAVAAARDAQ